MRVLLITSRADFGGGPEHLFKLLLHAPETVHYCVAAPQDVPYWDRYRTLLGVERVWRIPHRRFSLGALRRLAGQVRRERIQILHSHGKGASTFGRALKVLTGLPLVHTPHGIHFSDYSRPMKHAYFLYEKMTGGLMNHLVFVSSSEQTQAKSLRLWNGIPAARVSNGVASIPQSKIREWRKDGRQRLGLSDKDCIVVSISRYDFQKNMWESYKVAKALPEMKFLWIGDGPDRVPLGLQAQREKISNILIIGSVSNPLPYLAAADVYLSTSRWEGMPLAVLEGMSVGIPIIATDVVGNRDIVRDGVNGFLYPLHSNDIAVNLLERLRLDDSLRLALGCGSLELQRKEFTAERMARGVHDVYTRVVRPESASIRLQSTNKQTDRLDELG